MDDFNRLIAKDPSISRTFANIFDEAVTCDWCGCMTHEPVSLNGLQFAPSCISAYEADQAETEAIDLEDTERRLSRAFDLINSEVPGTHFQKLRMRRKQAARETAVEHRIEDVA